MHVRQPPIRACSPWVRLLLLVSLIAAPLSASELSKPNIVLILADDLGWSDVGFSGAKRIHTPVLNELARDGTVFTQFYASPSCTPSRAALLTGQYGPRHGVYSVDGFANTPPALRRVVGIRSPLKLPAGRRTLADVLTGVGYETALVGKWHLGDAPGDRPQDRGFGINVGGGAAGRPDSYFAPYGNIPLEPREPEEYLTDRLTDEAVTFVSRSRNRPFFLYFAAYAPHVPLHAPAAFLPTGDGEPAEDDPVPPYIAMVRHLDYCVGRLVAALGRLPRDRATLVVFVSDNGGQLLATSNRPLRGQKGTLYEGGIRVPALFWGPELVPSGITVETPASLIDLLPTLAGFAGAPLPEDHPVDGLDLAPLFAGRALDRDALFWHLPNYTGNLVSNARVWQNPASVIRQGRWKLIEHLDVARMELYDLDRDPGEANDLAALEPVRVAALAGRLNAWRRHVQAPVPTEPNPKFDSARRPSTETPNRRQSDEWRSITRLSPGRVTNK